MKITWQDRLQFDLHQLSQEWLIGLDEVGWGCIAGDLIIGAVAVHKSFLTNFPNHVLLQKVRDSKKLTAKIRGEIYHYLTTEFSSPQLIFTIGQSSINFINDHGLALAYDQCLEQIINTLQTKIDLTQASLLLDGSREPQFLKNYPIHKNIVIKGDDQSWSIGLASIIAKEYRDQLMTRLSLDYPQYHWAENKGYGTAAHIQALKEFGLSPWHRIKATTSILS